MVRTPSRSAAMIPGLPWQWAATTRSARAASATMAAISSSENCWWIGSSISLITPPDAQILMTLAPAPELHAHRPQAFRDPVAQLADPALVGDDEVDRQGVPSPWPPVVDSTCAGAVDGRPGEQPAVDSRRQVDTEAPDLAHAGDPAEQGRLGVPGGERRQPGDRDPHRLGQVGGLRAEEVGVCLPEPGEHDRHLHRVLVG